MSASRATRADKVSLPLRTWILIEIVFGIAAVLSVGLSPQDSAMNFAWPIQSVVTAALLGAFYMAVSSIFLVAFFVDRWSNMRVFVPAAIVFTATELLATFLHWDKFSIGTTAFDIWFASYVLPPPIFLLLYVWQQRRTPRRDQLDKQPLAFGLRMLLIVLAASIGGRAMTYFQYPELLVADGPIPFTPLTARALSGWLLALAIMMITAAWENDRNRVRILSPFFILLPPLIHLQLFRFPDEVKWDEMVVPNLFMAIIFSIGVYFAVGDWKRTLR